MRVLFLYPYPLKESPSQRFRFEQYIEILEHNNIHFKGQSFWDSTAWGILYKQGFYSKKIIGLCRGFLRRIKVLLYLPKINIVFIHRECTPIGPPVFEWIIARLYRKKIIYDFDDAIWLPNTSEENYIASLIKCHSKVKSICRWSYKISCGNDYLASFAKAYNPAVTVNPTTIDMVNQHNPSRYPMKPPDKRITIGWTGTHSTLKYLTPILPVIEQLENVHPHLRFVVIANKKPAINLKSLVFKPWNKKTEIEDLLTIDIGIMPLNDEPWSLYKCGFKALQYMALGIPTVASPVGVTNQIITDGVNGFLCKTLEEWSVRLDRLIQHPEIRNDIGKKGRKKITDHYSVASNTSTFLSLFE